MEHSLATAFSSDVQLSLEFQGRTYPLAEIGPNFATLRNPIELPPGGAEIVMRVDGQEHRWQVHLPDGAVPFDAVISTIDC